MPRHRALRTAAVADALSAPLRHRNPGAAAQQLDRFDKAHTVGFLNVAKHITTRLAAETVIELPFGIDRERPGLFLVERAQPHHVAPHPLERHGLADDLDDVAGGAHTLHPVVRLAAAARSPIQPPGIHRSRATVTPPPPSRDSPVRHDATWGCERRCRSTADFSMPLP